MNLYFNKCKYVTIMRYNFSESSLAIKHSYVKIMNEYKQNELD